MKLILKLLVGLFLICIIVFGFTTYRIYSFANKKVEKSDAILVLGCRVRGDVPSLSLERRMETALELYNNGYGKKIILSGGMGPGESITESEAMRRYFVSKGVEESKLIIEDKSTSTYENFKYSKVFMDENNIKSLVVVSNGYHLKRASKIAEKLGINATYKGFILKDHILVEAKGVIREVAAIFKFNLLGK